MFSTIVFDLDGTLLNTLEDLANAGNYTLSQLSCPGYPVESFRLMVGNGIQKLIYRMLPENRRDEATLALALSLFTHYYQNHALVKTKPYPGILSLLDSLHASGIQLAVLSNKNDDMVRQISSHYFGDSMEAAWGLRPEYPPKPDPSSLLALLSSLGAQPAATLYCGDSDVDMLTANKAEIASCGVLWGFRSKEELSASGACYLANTPKDIANIVFQIQ